MLSRIVFASRLRDASGKRLSTLTLREERDGNLRKLVFSVNLAKRNDPAPALAREAAIQLCAALSDGTIPLQWDKVDAARAVLVKKKFESGIGYDFRNAATRDKMLELYIPCLPRLISRASGGTFDGFTRALDIAGDVKMLRPNHA